MAAPFVSTTNSFLSTTPPSHPTPSSSSLPTTKILLFAERYDAKRQLNLCKAVSESRQPSPVSTRRSISICFITSFAFSLASRGHSSANAAVLEADDDEELLERVKKDRKKRLERQGVISSSIKETGYLQDLIYKLSKVGQAIENNDLSAAGSVLGGNTDTDWVQKANIAFTKLSSSPEEMTEVDTFNSSLASLISSVTRNDIESSKVAFVSSASAFEKWTTLTGLDAQLKGL
uniref:Thylakoid lumenal 16.5 kDa protein n=1 Tax=Rhizophora mucronata TaxID=61149 RepID=A0A2P2LHQ4_RHIMU